MKKEQIIDFIKSNPQLKTSEILSMRNLRSNSIGACDILCFIEEARK